MASIKNIDGLTGQQVQEMVNQGGRFVVFKYCISILIMTFNRGTDVYFVRPGESTLAQSLPFTLLSLVVGWWGIPWGPIYTIGAVYTNFSGGKDITNEVMDQLSLNTPSQQSQQQGYNIPGTDNAGNNTGGYSIPGSGNNNPSGGGYNIPR
jgi:hypothetical protein